MSKTAHLLSSIVVLSLFAGCGGEPPPPVGTVSGTITFSKQPTSDLDLMLISAKTGRGANTAIEDGTFTFSEPLLVGPYTAYLAPRADPDAQAAYAVTIDTAVPEKFWNEVQSPLKVQVEEGDNSVTLSVN